MCAQRVFWVSIVLGVNVLCRADSLAGSADWGDPLKPVAVKDLPDDGGTIDLGLSAKAGLLAVGADKGTIRFWDVKGKQLVPEFAQHPTDESGPRSFRSLAFASDGKSLASLDTRKAGSLCVWDVRTKKLLWKADGLRSGNKVGFAPDSKSVVALDFYKARVFDAETGKLLHEADIDPGYLSYLAFSPDGHLLVTAGNHFGFVIVWELATLKKLSRLQSDGPVQSICFASNRVLLVGSWNRPVKALDVTKEEKPIDLTEKVEGYVDGLHVSRDLDLFLTVTRASGTVNVFALGTGKRLSQSRDASVFVNVLSDDGKVLATAIGSRQVQLWDLTEIGKNR